MWAPPAELARCHGDAVLSAQLRAVPSDFRVDEIPAFEPSGAGEHLLLDIEKTGMNTAYVAGLLARWAGVPTMAVSYAGMKDRHAVTRQYFSVHLPKRQAPSLDTLNVDGLRVLASHWHARKLQRGALAGNRFVLILRNIQGERAAIEARLARVAQDGVANYFGEQRFGREGGNVQAAAAMFAGRRVPREQRGILLSAARSALFNAVLHLRVQENTWATGVEGDVWMLNGSRSIFGPESESPELVARVMAHDIHPAAPLWGKGDLRCSGAAREAVMAALAGSETLREGVEAAGMSLEFRSMRLIPGEMTWAWPEPTRLRLEFALPPGAYATTVLQAVGDCGE